MMPFSDDPDRLDGFRDMLLRDGANIPMLQAVVAQDRIALFQRSLKNYLNPQDVMRGLDETLILI